MRERSNRVIGAPGERVIGNELLTSIQREAGESEKVADGDGRHPGLHRGKGVEDVRGLNAKC